MHSGAKFLLFLLVLILLSTGWSEEIDSFEIEPESASLSVQDLIIEATYSSTDAASVADAATSSILDDADSSPQRLVEPVEVVVMKKVIDAAPSEYALKADVADFTGQGQNDGPNIVDNPSAESHHETVVLLSSEQETNEKNEGEGAKNVTREDGKLDTRRDQVVDAVDGDQGIDQGSIGIDNPVDAKAERVKEGVQAVADNDDKDEKPKLTPAKISSDPIIPPPSETEIDSSHPTNEHASTGTQLDNQNGTAATKVSGAPSSTPSIPPTANDEALEALNREKVDEVELVSLDQFREQILAEHKNKNQKKKDKKLKEQVGDNADDDEKKPKKKNKSKAKTKNTEETGQKQGEIETKIKELPRTDLRYNYAAFDAGAKLIASSDEMKGASTLLKEGSDDYMMAPCEMKKWFTVHLSDDIAVDTIVLTNKEHYSSGIADFQVLASETHPTDKWALIGNFRAENNNHMQIFQLEQREWARYLKFRLLSHYDDKYYCTLTSLRVHGSTMLETFREEMQANNEEVEQIQVLASASVGDNHPDEESDKEQERGQTTGVNHDLTVLGGTSEQETDTSLSLQTIEGEALDNDTITKLSDNTDVSIDQLDNEAVPQPDETNSSMDDLTDSTTRPDALEVQEELSEVTSNLEETGNETNQATDDSVKDLHSDLPGAPKDQLEDSFEKKPVVNYAETTSSNSSDVNLQPDDEEPEGSGYVEDLVLSQAPRKELYLIGDHDTDSGHVLKEPVEPRSIDDDDPEDDNSTSLEFKVASSLETELLHNQQRVDPDVSSTSNANQNNSVSMNQEIPQQPDSDGDIDVDNIVRNSLSNCRTDASISQVAEINQDPDAHKEGPAVNVSLNCGSPEQSSSTDQAETGTTGVHNPQTILLQDEELRRELAEEAAIDSNVDNILDDSSRDNTSLSLDKIEEPSSHAAIIIEQGEGKADNKNIDENQSQITDDQAQLSITSPEAHPSIGLEIPENMERDQADVSDHLDLLPEPPNHTDSTHTIAAAELNYSDIIDETIPPSNDPSLDTAVTFEDVQETDDDTYMDIAVTSKDVQETESDKNKEDERKVVDNPAGTVQTTSRDEDNDIENGQEQGQGSKARGPPPPPFSQPLEINTNTEIEWVMVTNWFDPSNNLTDTSVSDEPSSSDSSGLPADATNSDLVPGGSNNPPQGTNTDLESNIYHANIQYVDSLDDFSSPQSASTDVKTPEASHSEQAIWSPLVAVTTAERSDVDAGASTGQQLHTNQAERGKLSQQNQDDTDAQIPSADTVDYENHRFSLASDTEPNEQVVNQSGNSLIEDQVIDELSTNSSNDSELNESDLGSSDMIDQALSGDITNSQDIDTDSMSPRTSASTGSASVSAAPDDVDDTEDNQAAETRLPNSSTPDDNIGFDTYDLDIYRNAHLGVENNSDSLQMDFHVLDNVDSTDDDDTTDDDNQNPEHVASNEDDSLVTDKACSDKTLDDSPKSSSIFSDDQSADKLDMETNVGQSSGDGADQENQDDESGKDDKGLLGRLKSLFRGESDSEEEKEIVFVDGDDTLATTLSNATDFDLQLNKTDSFGDLINTTDQSVSQDATINNTDDQSNGSASPSSEDGQMIGKSDGGTDLDSQADAAKQLETQMSADNSDQGELPANIQDESNLTTQNNEDTNGEEDKTEIIDDEDLEDDEEDEDEDEEDEEEDMLSEMQLKGATGSIFTTLITRLKKLEIDQTVSERYVEAVVNNFSTQMTNIRESLEAIRAHHSAMGPAFQHLEQLRLSHEGKATDMDTKIEGIEQHLKLQAVQLDTVNAHVNHINASWHALNDWFIYQHEQQEANTRMLYSLQDHIDHIQNVQAQLFAIGNFVLLLERVAILFIFALPFYICYRLIRKFCTRNVDDFSGHDSSRRFYCCELCGRKAQDSSLVRARYSYTSPALSSVMPGSATPHSPLSPDYSWSNSRQYSHGWFLSSPDASDCSAGPSRPTSAAVPSSAFRIPVSVNAGGSRSLASSPMQSKLYRRRVLRSAFDDAYQSNEDPSMTVLQSLALQDGLDHSVDDEIEQREHVFDENDTCSHDKKQRAKRRSDCNHGWDDVFGANSSDSSFSRSSLSQHSTQLDKSIADDHADDEMPSERPRRSKRRSPRNKSHHPCRGSNSLRSRSQPRTQHPLHKPSRSSPQDNRVRFDNWDRRRSLPRPCSLPPVDSSSNLQTYSSSSSCTSASDNTDTSDSESGEKGSTRRKSLAGTLLSSLFRRFRNPLSPSNSTSNDRSLTLDPSKSRSRDRGNDNNNNGNNNDEDFPSSSNIGARNVPPVRQ